MADIDCTACQQLRDSAPDFSVNGVTDKVCGYLKNNTGLGGQSDNCTDLALANDCLIGQMKKELAAYDTCDWQAFMRKYIGNDHTMNAAENCAICAIDEKLDRIYCLLRILFNGVRFRIGEAIEGDAYAVAGKGVSFHNAQPSDGSHTSDLSLNYIAGGLVRGSGSFRFYGAGAGYEDVENFVERDNVKTWNYDEGGVDPRLSNDRVGNQYWCVTGRPVRGGELICEFRIKQEAFPVLRSFYTGFGQEQGGGGYHVYAGVIVGKENDKDPSAEDYLEGFAWAAGQHGDCNNRGEPEDPTFSPGHIVPAGWIYVQLRMTYIFQMSPHGTQYTPGYFMGIRVNEDGAEC